MRALSGQKKNMNVVKSEMMKAFRSCNQVKINGNNSHHLLKNEELQAFYRDLDKGLKNLDNSLSEDFISLGWIKEAINLLKSMHSSVVILVQILEVPVSVNTEGWLNNYMDETVKLLDICNALKAGISELGHYQLLVEFALTKLDNLHGNDNGEMDCKVRVLNALDMCKEEASILDSHKRRIILSKKLSDGTFSFSLEEDNLHRKFMQWNGLWGVMFSVKNVTCLISWLLISGLVYPVPLKLCSKLASCPYQWSTTFVHLCTRFDKKIAKDFAKEEKDYSSMMLKELGVLRAITEGLRDVCTHGAKTELGQIVMPEIQLLKQKSCDFREELDSVQGLVNSLFDEIVQGRDKLLHILSNDK